MLLDVIYLPLCVGMTELNFTFICLRWFDAVGWAAGRASGLQKNWVVGYRCGYLSRARCRFAYGPADATPLTHCPL